MTKRTAENLYKNSKIQELLEFSESLFIPIGSGVGSM